MSENWDDILDNIFTLPYASSIMIQTSDTDPINRLSIVCKTGTININSNGMVELTGSLTTDEAAKEFWEKISFYGTSNSNKEWVKEINNLKDNLLKKEQEELKLLNKIKELENQIEILTFKQVSNPTSRFDLEE